MHKLGPYSSLLHENEKRNVYIKSHRYDAYNWPKIDLQ